MQNAAKKQNATLAMAFLFVSLVMTPLSLKALGVSPNLSAGVDAWQHIAGLFADSHQPVNAAELLALKLMPEDSPRDEVMPFASRLLASAQPLDVQLSGEGRAAGSFDAAAPPTARCPKATKLAPRVTPSAPVAMNIVMPIEGVSAEGLTGAQVAQVVVPVRREAMQNYERAMAAYRIDLGDALRFAPKDFKMMVKVKPPAFPALPAVTTCAFRKSLTPEKVKQLRAAGWSFAFENATESAEKSEL